MRKYKIPCTWEVYGIVFVEADSIKEAIAKAKEDWLPLPTESSYVDGSFEVNEDFELIGLLNG